MKSQRRTDTTFACPLVGRRDLERRQAMHRAKVQRMTSSIDTRPPPAQPHLTLYGRDYVSKKRATTEAAFSDLKMIQSIAKTMTRKPEMPVRKGPVSLNADSRKQEIYRVMSENHRLLDRLECLEPVVSTRDLLRDYKWKQRYTVLTSHTKRLAGEYDAEVSRIRTEDKARSDQLNRSVQLRRSQHLERLQASGSMSAPSLSQTAPLASPDRPSPKPAPKRIPRDLGGASGSSKTADRQPPTSSPVGAPQRREKEKQQMEKLPPESSDVGAGNEASPSGKKPTAARVSFSEEELPTSPDPTRNYRKAPLTPHPRKASSDFGLEDPGEDVSDEAAKSLPPSSEAPVEEAVEAPPLEEAPATEAAPAEAVAAPAEAEVAPPAAAAPAEAEVGAPAEAEVAAPAAAETEAPAAEAAPEASPADITTESAEPISATSQEPEMDSDGFEKEDEPTNDSGLGKEFDPASTSGEAAEAAAPAQDAASASAGASPKVGVTSTSEVEEKDAYEDDEYEDDFADDTVNSPTAGNLSKAMDNSRAMDPDASNTFEDDSGTFEDSNFEDSKDGDK